MADHAAGTQTRNMSMNSRLLVVTVDRLPAWILPAYGSTWVSMPGLDALAGRGIVFDGLVATGGDPRETIAALLDGVLPGGARASAFERASVSLVTDDATVAEAAGPMLETRCIEPPLPPVTAGEEGGTALARLFDAAAEAVASGDHALVWCHAGSLGRTWDAPDECRAAYVDPDDPPPPAGAAVPDMAVSADADPDLVMGIRQAFAGQLTLLDRRLARLIGVAAEGWTILVVGIRGLPLGLHGRIGLGPLPPYGELIRLPAILADAAGRMAGQRFGGLATPADLGATLVELAGGVIDDRRAIPAAGRSLAGLFGDWSVAGRDRVISTTPEGVAVVTPHWHLTLPCVADDGESRPRLFTKPDDYFELCDVANRCPGVVDDLRGIAEAAAAGDVERAWLVPLGRGAEGSG
jgi:hypothetical protein